MRFARWLSARGLWIAAAVAVVVFAVVGGGAGARGASGTAGAARGAGGVLPGRPGFSPSSRELRASVLRSRHADLSTGAMRVGAEVPWLRRAESDTFVAGSGRLVTKIYPLPVNYRTSTGSFAPINAGLVASGSSGYVQQANNLGVVLPASAADPAQVGEQAGSLSVGLVGASGAGTVSGTSVSFPNALPGVDCPTTL